MEVDALNSSHPVSTPVEDPAQILEMFDEVSYEKVKQLTNCFYFQLYWLYNTAVLYWSPSFVPGTPETQC